MKTNALTLTFLLTISLLIAGELSLCHVSAQEKEATTAPPGEFTTLLDTASAAANKIALDPFDAAVFELNVNYTDALDRALATAQADGKLTDAVAITEEKEAIAKTNRPASTEIKEASIPLKSLRQTYQSTLSRMEKQRDKKLAVLQKKLVESLDTLVPQLTREGRLKEALVVKTKRDEVAKQFPFSSSDNQGIAASPSQPSDDDGDSDTPTEDVDRYYINKTWMSAARAFYAFESDGKGSRTHARVKTDFTWKKHPDGIVEVLGKMGPDSPPRTWFFKFDNHKTALFSSRRDVINLPLTAP